MRNEMITCVCLLVTATVQAAPDLGVVRDIVKARLETLSNLAVSYDDAVTYPDIEALGMPKQSVMPDGAVLVLNTSPSSSRRIFRFARGRAWYESHLVIAPVDEEASTQIPMDILSFSGDRVEHLWQSGRDGPYEGVIQTSTLLPDSHVELGLGLRAERQGWLTADVIDGAKVRLQGDEQAIVEWTDSKRRVHKWVYDPKLGYALTEYSVLVGGEPNIVVVASNMAPVEGVMLPNTITTRYLVRNQERTLETVVHTITVKQYTLGPRQNPPESFRVVWPKGTRVLDARSGLTFKVTSGDRLLEDQSIYELTVRRLPAGPNTRPSTSRGAAGTPHSSP